jgi:hypothetical protein
VYFTTRFESKARKTKEKLQNTHPDIDPNNIEWLLLDLSNLKSVDAAAHELKKKERKLDILSKTLRLSPCFVTRFLTFVMYQLITLRSRHHPMSL